MENKIGLDSSYSKTMSEKLNKYLGDVQVYYMNVRGYHWNIVGKQFFQLHAKFEELYDRLNEMADEIAERILMIGGSPTHAFSKYLKTAEVKEKENICSAEETVKTLLSDMQILLKEERTLLKEASEANDEGTVNLLSGYIEEQEKLVWMYSATLS